MSLAPDIALAKFKQLLRENRVVKKEKDRSFVVEKPNNIYISDVLSNLDLDSSLNFAKNVLIIIKNRAALKDLTNLGLFPDKTKIYVELCVNTDTDQEELQRVLEWIKGNEESVVFVSFIQEYNKKKFKKHPTKISSLLERVLDSGLKCLVKYSSYSKGRGNIKGLEEDVLNCTLAVCEKMNVAAISLSLPSLSVDIEQWGALTEVVKRRGTTIEGEVILKHGSIDDITWLEPLTQRFSKRSQLILTKNHPFDIKSNLVQAIRIVLMESHQHEPKIKFHGTPTFQVYIPIGKVEAFFESLDPGKMENITNLSFGRSEHDFKNAVTRNSDLSAEEVYQLVPTVTTCLQDKLVNVFDVSFDTEKHFYMKHTKEGASFLKFMKSRETKRLDYFIRNSKMGMYNRAKMMVVGAGAVGKTSLCRSLLGKEFNPNHDSTHVGDCKLNATDVNVSKWKELQTGQNLLFSDFFDMTEGIKEAEKQGNIKVNLEGSLKKYTTNEASTRWILNHKAKLKDPSRRIHHVYKDTVNTRRGSFFSMLSNKIFGIKANQYTKVRAGSGSGGAVQTTSQPLIPFSESLKNKKLSIWDFGGQKVFDVLHHLYLTNAGLVLLVVNLAHFFTRPVQTEHELNIWLQSLCVYTENIKLFIVGTRCKTLSAEKLVKVNSIISQALLRHDSLYNVDYDTKDKRLKFFPVDNSIGQGIKEVKVAIAKALQPDPKFKFKLPANEEIPLAWMFFIHLVHRDYGNISSLDELFSCGESMGFDREEMKNLVEFFTKTGIIISFHDRFKNLLLSNNASEMFDDIVLKPEWLLSALGSFIWDDEFQSDVLVKVSNLPSMGTLVDVYNKYGLLANKLLEMVLEDKDLSAREVIFIKNVCSRMLIFSKLSTVPEIPHLSQRHRAISNGFWVVPAMNKASLLQDITPFPLTNATAGTIFWDDVVPQGLFERCICSLLDQDVTNMKLLFLTRSRARLQYLSKEAEITFVESRQYSVAIASSHPPILRKFRKLLFDMNEGINELGFALKLNAKISFADSLQVKTNREENRVIKNTLKKRTKQMKWDCFLSHCWGKQQKTHKQVVEIGGLLKDDGINIWLDEEQIKDDVLTQMLEGMNHSGAFIAFITKDYLEASDDPNSNAGRECRYYASKLGAQYMIPVLLDADFCDPKTWIYSLGLLLPTTFFIDFTSEEMIKKNLPELCERIRHVANMDLDK